MITRKQLADTIDALDAEIAVLQDSKRDTFQEYREQITDAAGKEAAKAEIEAVKAAIKRRQAVVKKGEAVVSEKDALIEEIFDEISAARAPRATREIIKEFDAETGEILESDDAFAAGVAAVRAKAAPSIADADLVPYEVATPIHDSDFAEDASGARPDDAPQTIPERLVGPPADPLMRSEAATRKDAVLTAPAPRTKAQIFDAMGLPTEPDPRCRKPHICDRTSHVKLCLDCRVAAGLEMEVPA